MGVWGVDCASRQGYKVCVVTAPHGSALNDILVKEGKKVRTIYVGVIAAITGYLWVTGIAMAQETMQPEVSLLVYRRLDNRAEGLADDSPRALDLHNQRKQALHEVLDQQSGVTVLDWGQTDDTAPHERVQIIIAVARSRVFAYAIKPSIQFVAKKLAEKGVDEVSSQLVNWLISELRPKQDSKAILDFQIKLRDGTWINVRPPDMNATITID